MLKARDTAFVTLPDGSERLIHRGDVVADDDPVAEGRSALFEPFEFVHSPVVITRAAPADQGDQDDAGDEGPAPSDPVDPGKAADAKPGTRRAPPKE